MNRPTAHLLAIRFTLEPVPPFRLDLTAWALRRRPANIVDRWDGDAYRRAVKVDGTIAEVEVRQTGSPEVARLDVSVTTGKPIEPTRVRADITAALGRLLGLDIDLGDFYRRARQDPHLGPLAERYRGLKPPRFPTIFEGLANAIACQQLTLTVGIVLLNRLAESYGPTGPGQPPSRQPRLPRRRRPQLRHARRPPASWSEHPQGRVPPRAGQRCRCGDVDLAALITVDNDSASASLQQLRGVGRWSAEYALLRRLGRLGVFPGDDVGARYNLRRRLGLDTPLDHEGVRRAVAPWAPCAGLAYFHLLIERIDDAGWIDDLKGTGSNRAHR
jgi:DNA-3-methyladenine glycosylase II